MSVHAYEFIVKKIVSVQKSVYLLQASPKRDVSEREWPWAQPATTHDYD